MGGLQQEDCRGRTDAGGVPPQEEYHLGRSTRGLKEDCQGSTAAGRVPWEDHCLPRAAGYSWPSSLHFPQELPQVEITKAYFAKQADEITLQQADVVLVLQEEDGECG